MRISVVYSVTTKNREFFRIFYPTRRLKEEALARGLDIDFWLPLEVESDLDSFLKHAEGGPILFRGDVPQALRETIEGKNCICINSSAAATLARDKLATYKFLDILGVPYPRLYTPSFHEGMAESISFPAIMKPRYGRMGIGVSLVTSQKEYSERCSQDTKEEYLLQEYICTSTGRDLRILFIDKAIVASIERRSESLASNWHQGGSIQEVRIDSKLKELSLMVAEKAGLFYGSIDFLFGTGKGLKVCELNDYPGFEGLEKNLDINYAGLLIDAILKEYTRQNTRK